jgi:hypothetical protein
MSQVTFAEWMIAQCEAYFAARCNALREYSEENLAPYDYEDEDYHAETLHHERGMITRMWEDDGVSGYC